MHYLPKEKIRYSFVDIYYLYFYYMFMRETHSGRSHDDEIFFPSEVPSNMTQGRFLLLPVISVTPLNSLESWLAHNDVLDTLLTLDLPTYLLYFFKTKSGSVKPEQTTVQSPNNLPVTYSFCGQIIFVYLFFC